MTEALIGIGSESSFERHEHIMREIVLIIHKMKSLQFHKF